MATALSLYKRYSKAELLQMITDVESDPVNQTSGSLYLYTDKARKLLSNISQAIAWHVEDARSAAGRPVPINGYSGRQSNRRP